MNKRAEMEEVIRQQRKKWYISPNF
jgi:hypothetical protein